MMLLKISYTKLLCLLVPLFAEFCVLLLSRSGALMLSATVFRLRGLSFSALVLFSSLVRVRGSFTIRDKGRSINDNDIEPKTTSCA